MGRLKGIEPSNVGTTIRCVNHFATTAKNSEWFRTESNCRHMELQSIALPTELLNHNKYIVMAVSTGIEPAISCVTGRRVNRYTTGPKLNGDSYGTRTRVTAVKGRCLNRLTKEPWLRR